MVWLKRSFLFLVILGVFLVTAEGGVHQRTGIWDTKSILGEEIDIGGRENWEIIPPPTTNYSFKGDVALENGRILLLFSSEKGDILLYSKEAKEEKPVKIVPIDLKGERASSIRSAKILKNNEDEATLEVIFLTKSNRMMRQAFSLGREKRFLEIRPLENAGAVQVRTPIRFTIIPAYTEYKDAGVGYQQACQDVVFNPRDYSASRLLLPVENIILNLIDGEERIVTITWPFGEQTVSALLSGKGKRRFIDVIQVTFDKKSVYIGILEAPGIWHEVKLDEIPYLKDVAIDWKRPFPAGWKTNFCRKKRNLSIDFKKERYTRWKPEEGFIVWPCWFDGEKAFLHLNRKVLRYKGRDIALDNIALIYPLGREKNIPQEVDTPGDILRQTLGDTRYKQMLDLGKRLSYAVGRWPGERPAILGACAANGALLRLFKKGLATEQAFLVDLLVNGVLRTVDHTLRQLEGFKLSTQKIMEFISTTKKENPRLVPFLGKMEKILREMEQELEGRFYTPWFKRIGKDALWKEFRPAVMEYTIEVGERIKKLAREGNPEELVEVRVLRPQLGYWMTENATAVYRRHLRYLQQEAIIVAAESEKPEVMKAAEKIRRLAREARRNPGWGF